MKKSMGAVILAAGAGTRLKLQAPKPLAKIMGKFLVDFPLQAVQNFIDEAEVAGIVTAVLGHKRQVIESYLAENYPALKFAYQKNQLGTADALRAYFALGDAAISTDYTLVMCADTPLLTARELHELWDAINNENLDGVAATFQLSDPRGYGRIIRGETGFKIVEEKDADDETKKINLVNSGLYIFKTSYLVAELEGVHCQNEANEFYLTDVFKWGAKVEAIEFEDALSFQGVNTLAELEQLEGELRRRKLNALRNDGVRFLDSTSVHIDWDVSIAQGTVIYPNVYIEGQSQVGEDVIIEPGSFITDTVIARKAHIKAYSRLEGAAIKAEAQVGPFARIRPGGDIGEQAKIGNFVEIKKAVIKKGAKVSHLSYVGDAEIGEDSNIGCGFITCNYDGAQKHFTKIGKQTFVGSDTQMIAPVEIGDNCFVASGSTINQSMEDGAFAISRGRQVTKNGMAKKFLRHKDSRST